GIVNDPIGAILAALVFEVVSHPHGAEDFAGEAFWQLALTILVGVTLGGLGALLVLQTLKRYLIPDYLQNPMLLAFLLIVFALSNQLQHESGLVSVTLMGVFLANQRDVPIRHIVEFKENLRVLLISTLFIVLASRLELSWTAFSQLGWGSVLFVALLILVVRPVSVLLSTIGSALTWQERAFLSWIHPRGIVAAAVSSLLALQIQRRLGEIDPLPALAIDASRFELIVFLVIIGTVSIYGLTLAPLARRLGLSGENPQGILFVGASRAVREIAKAIQHEKHAVLLVDTNHLNNRAARMAGLPISFASIGSEFIQEEIDLGGIGRLLAMTPNDEVNTLAAISFRERFGTAEVYQLASAKSDKDRKERAERIDSYRGGRRLFNRPVTLAELEARFAAGAVIKKTTLSDDFTYNDFRARYGDRALILFRIDENGKLHVATESSEIAPKSGTKLIALVEEAKSKDA
ncbi:MAG: cation:proton antiporter, partial [Planctomycetales bacterium]|nr:cation:proton antiporter [Planctomycetales bacterium]